MSSQKFNSMSCTSIALLIHLPKIPSAFSIFNVFGFRRRNEYLGQKMSLFKVVCVVLW